MALDALRRRMQDASPLAVILLSSLSAFCIYVCTYGFRKGFAAGTYAGLSCWGVDYKILLVISQISGYALSKIIGIKFIAEVSPSQRVPWILGLIALAWFSLLVFAWVPVPWGMVCFFVNGIPLGLIWGLIYSYLEGRRSTELMGAILCTSFIFSAGLVKSIGQWMIRYLGVSEQWMPFLVGAIFVVPLVLSVVLLNCTPAPTDEDKALRTERVPMYGLDRRRFVSRFWPGLVFNLLLYIMLTVMRDIRDYFEVEIWQSLAGKVSSFVYSAVDAPVSLVILAAMSLLIYVKDNRRAFMLAHVLIGAGFACIGIGAVLFHVHALTVYYVMYLTSFGLYLAYVPYSILFFDRLLAVFRERGNVGFLIYLADSIGYSCSVALMLFKQFSASTISWGSFFIGLLGVVALTGIVCIGCSVNYFSSIYRSGHPARHRNIAPPLSRKPL